MTNLIQQIRKVITSPDCNIIKIEIWSDTEIAFLIYDREIPIGVNLKEDDVYLDCEMFPERLTADELNEISQIIKIIEKNINEIKECLK